MVVKLFRFSKYLSQGRTEPIVAAAGHASNGEDMS